NPLLKIYIAEKTAANPVITAHSHPHFSLQGITMRKFGNLFFSSLLSCSLSRVQTQLFVSAAAEGAGSEERTAGDRTRRRRLNKLSCADWLPHDRGFVSGLPHSKDERRSGDRLITGQEGSPPRPCRRQCAPADLLLPTPCVAVGGFDQPWSVGWAMRAIAPIKPTISRAIAVGTTTFGLPAAASPR